MQIVVNLHHTALIQTAAEIVYAFLQCWFVHIQNVPRNLLQTLVSHWTSQSGTYIQFMEVHVTDSKTNI